MTWTRFEDEIELRRLYNKMEVRIKENDVLRAKRSELNKRRDKLLRQRNEVQKKLAEYRPAYQKFLELCEWAGIENKDSIAVTATPDEPLLAGIAATRERRIPAPLPPRVRPRTRQRRFAIIFGSLALAMAAILVLVIVFTGKTPDRDKTPPSVEEKPKHEAEETPKPVIDNYGLPHKVWKACRYKHKGKWILDMTTDDWVKLSWKKQREYASAYQKCYAKSIDKPVEKTIHAGKTSFEMMLIPPGRFWMGSPEDEPERDGDEARHRVIISQAFWIQKTEITQGQWKAVMGKEKNPSYFKNAGDDAPVENISWKDITIDFLPKLGKNWNLPTEAEWEYVCRAGTVGMSYIGYFEIKGRNNAPKLDAIAWYGGNSGVKYEGGYDSSAWSEMQYPSKNSGTHPVGKKKTNAWGCYDFHGNVWEWCRDWHTADYPNLEKDAVDPKGPTSGSDRVYRGGSWCYVAGFLRCAYRNRDVPGSRFNNLGFRLFFREAMP